MRLIVAMLLLLKLPAQSAVFVFEGINAEIPDANESGLADVRNINTSEAPIEEISVSLDISGIGDDGYNGDLYATLQHESGFAVLLNRVGKRSDDSFGYSDSGLNVTFQDTAVQGDIHIYRLPLSGNHDTALGGSLTGTWAPDGRSTDPNLTLDTSLRTELLGSFVGQNPNGAWTLFVADLSGGASSRLNGWSLDITQVPEPEEWLSIAGMGLLVWALVRRHAVNRGR
jgi:subtilisin-like proprotein convertase family protein